MEKRTYFFIFSSSISISFLILPNLVLIFESSSLILKLIYLFNNSDLLNFIDIKGKLLIKMLTNGTIALINCSMKGISCVGSKNPINKSKLLEIYRL